MSRFPRIINDGTDDLSNVKTSSRMWGEGDPNHTTPDVLTLLIVKCLALACNFRLSACGKTWLHKSDGKVLAVK